MAERTMKSIMVLGAGAMGSLFGARLALAGNDVVLVDVWRDHVDAINRDGLRFEDHAGEHTVRLKAALAADLPADLHPDLLIVFTKTLHSAAALESVRHCIGPGTWLLTLQNGLGNVDVAARFVPRAHLMHGVTNYPSDLRGPGSVASHGEGYVRIDGVDGSDGAGQSAIAALLRDAGFDCVLDASVERAIWEKVAFNAALNSLAAVTRLPVGGVGGTESGRTLARRIVDEVAAVAQARGIPVDRDATWQSVEKAFAEHAVHQPSMLQDIQAHRKTEIESINGAVVRFAREPGVPVPVTETLCHLVRMIE
jgi:2-dehydropantoate 2-reductase